MKENRKKLDIVNIKNKRKNKENKKYFAYHLLFYATLFLSIIEILHRFFPKVYGATIKCNPKARSSRWSYDAIMPKIFDERNFLCRIFRVRCYDKELMNYSQSLSAMRHYFSGGGGAYGNYFEFLKSLNPKSLQYFCLEELEVPIRIRWCDWKICSWKFSEVCPSKLRKDFPGETWRCID